MDSRRSQHAGNFMSGSGVYQGVRIRTFPGESVSIPTLTIPWGIFAPMGGDCLAYKLQTRRRRFGRPVKHMRDSDALFRNTDLGRHDHRLWCLLRDSRR
jgi:hypothetical protein